MGRERKIKVGYNNESVKVGYCGRWGIAEDGVSSKDAKFLENMSLEKVNIL